MARAVRGRPVAARVPYLATCAARAPEPCSVARLPSDLGALTPSAVSDELIKLFD